MQDLEKLLDELRRAVQPGPDIRDGIDPKIKATVKSLCALTNTPVPQKWGTLHCDCDKPDCPSTLNAGATLLKKKIGLFVGQALPHLLSEEELRAVLAHELGHIHNGDIYKTPTAHLVGKLHEREFAADAFAAKYGLGPALASALRKMGAAYGPDALDQSDDFHPPATERIARLETSAASVEKE